MEKKSSSEDWFSSPFFHKFLTGSASKDAEAFINQLINHLHPAPGSRVLDSACGQGLYSQQLASLGFEVTGVDASPANIDLAKRTVRDNPEFYLHDLRLPFWGSYFQVAVNLFEGFGYYRTRREDDNAVRTVASSLQKGGVFVIDYPNTHYLESRLREQESHRSGDTYYQVQNFQNETHFYKNILVTDPSLSKPSEFSFDRAKLSLGDFTDMLSFQGMQVQEVFGNYQLAPYHINETPRLIVVAKK
jgi:SAM-dependent methyltransferase